MTDPTLKPCPFCGMSSAFVERADSSSCFVQCDCNARGPVAVQEGDDEDIPGHDAAVSAWNRRAAIPAAAVPTQQPSWLGRALELEAHADEVEDDSRTDDLDMALRGVTRAARPIGAGEATETEMPTEDEFLSAIDSNGIQCDPETALAFYEVWRTLAGASPAPAAAASVQPVALDRYDAGLLNDYGGGNVGWWQDYIRSELATAHDFYEGQVQSWFGIPPEDEGASPIGVEAGASEGVKAMLVNELVEHGKFLRDGVISEDAFVRAVNHYIGGHYVASPSIGSAGDAGKGSQQALCHSAGDEASAPSAVHSGLAAPNAPSAGGSDAQDARRYHWWRDNSCREPGLVARVLGSCIYTAELDAAIDQQMSGHTEERGE